MLDLSHITPQAKPIVEAAAAVYLKHTQRWFIGLIIHGSAMKCGFIPGCSDIDFQLYLDNTAFTTPGQLPLEICLSIYQDLSQINPAPFRYIQCFAFSNVLPEGYTGPIPGAYHIVAGTLPIPEATAQQLQATARKRLTALNPVPTYITGSLLEYGSGRLASNIRFLCTDVWPTLYQVLTLQGHDALYIWSLNKSQAIELLPSDTVLGQTIRAFYRAVQTYYPTEKSVEDALNVVEIGVAFLQAVKSWWSKESI